MFVLLQHETPDTPAPGIAQNTHWDFLVEIAGHERLAAWRLLQDPRASVGEIPAERIPDHRRLYLDYEGEISGGRGSVRRIDRGPATIELFDGCTLVAVLAGQVLRGRCEIRPRQAGSNDLVFRHAKE